MKALTILGGGPAGLAVAYYAWQCGIPFLLFEKSETLGGLCRTFQCGHHRYDAGAHRFHDRDPEITRDVLQLLGNEIRPVSAPSKIYLAGRFIDFPLTPMALLLSGGLRWITRVGMDLVRSRLRPRGNVSFADFAIKNFGETLARQFLLNYSEKVWGLPAEQLSPEVATRRLQGMTLRTALIEVVAPGRKVEHLDGRFLYPASGYGRIVQALAQGLPAETLRTAQEAVWMGVDGRRISEIRFSSGLVCQTGGKVISTIPMTILVRLLGESLSPEAHEACRGLQFRHLRLIFLRLSRPRLSEHASVYLPDPDLCISRVSEPKNRSAAMAPPDETSLVLEIPCFIDDPVYSLSEDQLVQRATRELAQIGLLDPRWIIEWRHHFLQNAYPVYSLDFSARVTRILEALGHIENLDLLGRGGLFFYSHLHHQLRFGKDYVRAQMEASRSEAHGSR